MWGQHRPKQGTQGGGEEEKERLGPGTDLESAGRGAYADAEVRWLVIWTVHLNAKCPSDCWERNSKPCYGDEATCCGKRFANFLLYPNSPYPPAPTTVLHLVASKSKNHLFHVSLLPMVSAVNPSVSTYVSSPLLTYQLCEPGACNWAS